MARHSRKLPIASTGAEPELAITDSDWRRIERGYGTILSTKTRKKIAEATKSFIAFEAYERAAERLAHSEAIIAACKTGASEFQKMLLSTAFKSTDAGIYARHLIHRNFHDPRLDSTHLFQSMSGVLTSFIVACTSADRELHEGPSFREGTTWGIWVRRLTQVMKTEALPWQVRKDAGNKSKTDQQSPFVKFIWELQACIPEKCRRSMHSKSALADAISDVRTSGLKNILNSPE